MAAQTLPTSVPSARHGVGQGWVLTPSGAKASRLCRVREFSFAPSSGSCYLPQSSENQPQLVLFTTIEVISEVTQGSQEGNEVEPLWKGNSGWQQLFLHNTWKQFDERMKKVQASSHFH